MRNCCFLCMCVSSNAYCLNYKLSPLFMKVYLTKIEEKKKQSKTFIKFTCSVSESILLTERNHFILSASLCFDL